MSAAPNTETLEVADSPAADMLQHSQDLVRLVAQLHAEVSAAKDEAREYATAAAVWQERARVLSDQLALKAPEPPQEALTAVEPAPAPSEPPTPHWRGRWSLVLAIVAVLLLLFVQMVVWPR